MRRRYAANVSTGRELRRIRLAGAFARDARALPASATASATAGVTFAIEDARDDVVGLEPSGLTSACERARGRHLHLARDLSRANVQGAAEDARESENVVDLVG